MYKILNITQIYHETRNKLIIYAVLCRNVAIFYQQKLASLFQVQEKIENVQEFKVKLFEWLFTDDSQIKIIWLHVVVVTEHGLLYF